MRFSSAQLYFGVVGAAATATLAAPARGRLTRRATCTTTDNDGSALTGSSVDGSFVTCSYKDAGECTYFFADGSFSSGSSTCPQGLPQDLASSSNSISPDINCAAVDDDGSPLTASRASVVVAQLFATCVYQEAGDCTYFFTDGALSNGVSTCPPGQPQTGGTATTISTTAEAKTSAATVHSAIVHSATVPAATAPPAPGPTPTTTSTTIDSTPLPPPTTTSSTEATSRSGHSTGRNAAIIIGTVVGAVVLLLSIVLSVVIIMRRRARGWRNLEAEPFSMDHDKSPSRVAAADVTTPRQVYQSGPNESRVSSSNREPTSNEPVSGLAEQLWGLESRFRRIEALVSVLRRASGRSGRSSGMSVRSAPPAYSDAASVS